MNDLKFCPQCGKKNLNWDGEKKWSCSSCNFGLYHNVAGAVAVLIRCGDELFFTRRSRDPQKGFLDLAGGFVDPKETAEETCVRELFEELQLVVNKNNLRYLGSLPNVYHYNGINYNTIDLFFEYEVNEKFAIHMEDSEISETKWIPKNEILVSDLAFESQKKFLETYLS